jgi:hypothetical protein
LAIYVGEKIALRFDRRWIVVKWRFGTPAEVYLLPASLVFAGSSVYLLKANLLFAPGMRKYGVGRDAAADELAKDEVAVGFAFQEAHRGLEERVGHVS